MKWTRRKTDEDEEIWDNIFPKHLQSCWTKVKHDNRVRIPGLVLIFIIFSRTFLFRVETPVTDPGWSGWSDPTHEPGHRC